MIQLMEVAELINSRISLGNIVIASWNDPPFKVVLVSAKHQSREDGDHLVGYDGRGEEYCIGGAYVMSYSPLAGVSLWEAGN
jgi:hypothetical protein